MISKDITKQIEKIIEKRGEGIIKTYIQLSDEQESSKGIIRTCFFRCEKEMRNESIKRHNYKLILKIDSFWKEFVVELYSVTKKSVEKIHFSKSETERDMWNDVDKIIKLAIDLM